MSPFKQSLLPIPDPRRAQGKLCDLLHLLLFSILAVMSGATSYRRIHQFIRAHQARLNEAFGRAWRRTPAYSTVRYALRGLDVASIAPHFQAHAAGLTRESAVVALDGKTPRGSLDRFEDRRAAQVLSAFAVGERIVLSQIVLEDTGKEHEIQAAQRLIEELGLAERRLYPGRPAPSKKRLRLRGPPAATCGSSSRATPPSYPPPCGKSAGPGPTPNRPTRLILAAATGSSHARRGPGPWPRGPEANPGTTTSKPWSRSAATSKFSILLADASSAAASRSPTTSSPARPRRRRWPRPSGVTGPSRNRLHHVLDVSLGEDASRIRRNPGGFAQLHHFALNLMRYNGETNIRRALFDNGMDLDRLLNYKGIKPV